MISSSASTFFTQWAAENPDWKEKLGVYKRDSSTYQRVICHYQQGHHGHQYHSVINVLNGDIYLDCRRRKIAAKHLTMLVLRPLHACVKTIWHASIVGPLALEIFACIKKGQSLKALAEHTWQSLTDIVRTPFYSLAMLVTHVAALILGAISPNTLYHTRFVAGWLERKMLRLEDYSFDNNWVMTPCFYPLTNVMDRRQGVKIGDHLDYFGKLQINFRQKHRALFNDCAQLLPLDKAYMSPAAPHTAPQVIISTDYVPPMDLINVQPAQSLVGASAA